MLFMRSDTDTSGIRTRGVVSNEGLIQTASFLLALTDDRPTLNDRSISRAASLPEAPAWATVDGPVTKSPPAKGSYSAEGLRPCFHHFGRFWQEERRIRLFTNRFDDSVRTSPWTLNPLS
jgi:hypothetical protein